MSVQWWWWWLEKQREKRDSTQWWCWRWLTLRQLVQTVAQQYHHCLALRGTQHTHKILDTEHHNI